MLADVVIRNDWHWTSQLEPILQVGAGKLQSISCVILLDPPSAKSYCQQPSQIFSSLPSAREHFASHRVSSVYARLQISRTAGDNLGKHSAAKHKGKLVFLATYI